MTVNGGVFAPQGSPSISACFTHTAGGTLEMRINGTTPGTQHDRLNAGGPVRLNGTLDLVPGAGPLPGQSFVLINKTSAGSVSGTFTGRPQESVFTENDYDWVISYAGGNDNDVVVSIATEIQKWRFAHFNSAANGGTGQDGLDANGVVNTTCWSSLLGRIRIPPPPPRWQSSTTPERWNAILTIP